MRQELRRALDALDDEEVRAQLRKGEMGAFGDVDLSDQERAFLRAVASGDREVEGFDVWMTELLAYVGDTESELQDQVADQAAKTKLGRTGDVRRFRPL